MTTNAAPARSSKMRLDAILNSEHEADDSDVGGLPPPHAGNATDGPPSSHPVPSTRPPVARRHAKRRESTNARQRHEIERLKTQLQSLHAQIHVMEITTTARKMSYWERMVKIEGHERLKAVSTNEQLTRAVEDHDACLAQLTQFMQKKQRWMNDNDPSPHWDIPILPSIHGLEDGVDRRHRAMHAIVDREHARMASVLHAAGLVGHSTDTSIFQSALKSQPSTGAIVFEIIEHMRLAAPFDVVGAAVWASSRTSLPLQSGGGITQTIETIDDDTLYNCSTDARHETPCHANFVMKRYRSATSLALVGRTILVDPMREMQPIDLVEDMTVWTQAEAVPDDPHACVLTLLMRLNLGVVAVDDRVTSQSDIDDVAARMQKVSLAQTPKVQGNLVPDAVRSQLDTPNAPVTLGNLHIYLGRCLCTEEPFKQGINSVVEAYQNEQRRQRSGET
ncbi:Aste57867_8547 [Aphanomyces stellatus]|uniref:Aste57867_8547 protein n=1 Tax=Aphanomyces stellatus TaxID=120398 RepID=A0A485KKL3_9STRA|nr:hypothetical protein As57867_008515 [Aphanomyces stellatus]VFT85433.1 Aste57867_8547 [Aphanomyces stellatus]